MTSELMPSTGHSDRRTSAHAAYGCAVNQSSSEPAPS